ncbi:MAG TPA: toprim domain-containing protein [Stellaceae bacterium]|nr:toprim domain-containing protein [Stellaceae bacterium]
MLAALRRHGLIGGRSGVGEPATRPPLRIDPDDASWRTALARRLWDDAQDASRSPVAAYLSGRGITMPVPASLRWAPTLRRPDGTTAPAMVARIDGPDGELLGVHRTWLTRDAGGAWCRRERAMLGRAAGSAVRLAAAAETFLVGEGIETTIAGMMAVGLPGWAALSTSGLVALALPKTVHEIVICADNDASGAGKRAARDVAARWLAEDRRVWIAMPPEPETDMADLLSGRTSAIIETADVAA